VPFSTAGAELLFEVFSQRYERGSTIVTSNLPFEEWTSVFGAEPLDRRASRPADPPCPHRLSRSEWRCHHGPIYGLEVRDADKSLDPPARD
jgi:hypothetical protein